MRINLIKIVSFHHFPHIEQNQPNFTFKPKTLFNVFNLI